MTHLTLPAAMEAAILAHLAAALPNEGCGLLATMPDGEGERAVRFYPGDNIDRSPVRYTMDPRQVMDALDELEAAGWRLGAIVHSHPRTAPEPSPTDLREAYYPGVVLVIASFRGAEPELRAWRLDPAGATFTELPLRRPAGARTD